MGITKRFSTVLAGLAMLTVLAFAGCSALKSAIPGAAAVEGLANAAGTGASARACFDRIDEQIDDDDALSHADMCYYSRGLEECYDDSPLERDHTVRLLKMLRDEAGCGNAAEEEETGKSWFDRFRSRDEEPKQQQRPRSSEAPKSSKNDFEQEGVASWYGKEGGPYDGNITGCGETYDPFKLTAAHRELPCQTRIMIHNLDNDLAVVVKINDRGPYVDGRIVDLSYAAAVAIQLVEPGTARVRITRV